ncbi:MAG: hypothetical protein DIU52_006465 [bacterium]|jgi:hypothetical protein
MSIWTLGTWLSIVVLIVGSTLVFAWFLRDVRLVFRDTGPTHGEPSGERGTERRAGG